MKEIAAVMGKSESAVKQKHYRLCIKVRRLIKEAIENVPSVPYNKSQDYLPS